MKYLNSFNNFYKINEDSKIENNLLDQERFEIGAKDIGGKQEDEANAVAGQLIKKFAEQYPNVYESTNL